MTAEPTPDSIQSLEQARQQILQKIATIGDLRPGPLHERYVKCRKPGCRCRRKDHPGHGPYFLLQVRRGDSKRTTRSVPVPAVNTIRAQVAECRRLRRLVAELIKISERLCDARGRARNSSEVPSSGKKRPVRSGSARQSKPS